MTLATTIKADEIKKSIIKTGGYNYGTDVVTFVERGIKFHVFLNGDFDYNTRYSSSTYYDYNGRRTRRTRGIRIERDYRGRVKRVGNTFINYDYRGNVKRIGSIFIDYRHGQLVRVGNLKITYNRWGNPRFYGNVKHTNYYDNNYGYNSYYGSIWDYNDDFFYKREFRNNYRKYKEDADFYYYKAVPNAKIGKRSKVIKRKKSSKRKDKKRKRTDGIYDKNINKAKRTIRKRR